MGARILVHLQPSEEGTATSLPEAVTSILSTAGATQIRPSHPELPGLYTAILPQGADATAVIEQLKQTPGVRYAELDQFQSST